jgi:ketosteroid isomerase-like protein
MHPPARDPDDLERFFVARANAGDVEGLVALYEANATLDAGDGESVVGHEELRRFFTDYLASAPQFDPSLQTPAVCSGDLALTSSRLGNGDITGEVARRQPDGTWLWVIDRFTLGKAR